MLNIFSKTLFLQQVFTIVMDSFIIWLFLSILKLLRSNVMQNIYAYFPARDNYVALPAVL